MITPASLRQIMRAKENRRLWALFFGLQPTYGYSFTPSGKSYETLAKEAAAAKKLAAQHMRPRQYSRANLGRG